MTRRYRPERGQGAAAPTLLRVLLLLGLAPWRAVAAEDHASASWPQWGGPTRNFMVDAGGLAASWPEEGPRRLWSRPLGEGHSAIVVGDGRLFTLYRPRPDGPDEGELAEEERVVALEAATGKTLWEHGYPSAPLDFRFGAGPHATPLLVGGRLFTTGTNKQVHALDAKSGRVLWSHDLVEELGAPPTLVRPAVKAGYACSPLAYGETVILTAGGEGQSVIAFNQRDGSLAWSSGDFLISPASPLLIELDGQEQLLVFGGQTVNGLDPRTGDILWSHPHDTRGDMNNSTPIWGEDNLLFLSSAYDGGARLLALSRTAAGTAVEERWFSRRLRILFSTAIRLGDTVYGTSGDFGTTLLTALDLESGEALWQERGFPRATLLHADGRLILLDEDGSLALATATREGLEVHSRFELFETTSWTVPTLVGTTLYARDRRLIVALDLGEGAGP